MGEDVPFLRELVRLFRGKSKTTELWNSARRPSKTVTKIKKQPGRPWKDTFVTWAVKSSYLQHKTSLQRRGEWTYMHIFTTCFF